MAPIKKRGRVIRLRRRLLKEKGKAFYRGLFENYYKKDRSELNSSEEDIQKYFSNSMKDLLDCLYQGFVESIPTASDDDITEVIGNSIKVDIPALRKYLRNVGLFDRMVFVRQRELSKTDRRTA